MISVAIIVNNYTQTQGVNSVVDQFFVNKEQFKKNGIEISSVYDCNSRYTDIPNRVQGRNNAKSLFKAKIKKRRVYLNRLSESFILFSKIRKMGIKAANIFLNDTPKYDVVLAQDVFAAYKILKKGMPIKVYFMTHMFNQEYEQLIISYPHTNGSLVQKYFLRVYEYVYKHSDQIITICENAKRSICNRFPIVKDKIFIIYNAIQDVGIRANPGNNDVIKFVSASSLNTRKGTDLLIDYLKIQNDVDRKNTEFHIYGHGDLYKELSDLKKDLGLDNLYMYGRVQNPVQYYRDKDVFLIVSRDECLPMGIIEAMCVGMPILATNVGAIYEMVDNNCNGWLIAPNVDEITETIKDVIARKKDLFEKGSNSKNIYDEKFSSKRWIQNFSDVFNRVCT